MTILDKKRLIFSFYLTNDWEESETNILHIRLLSKYLGTFDDVIFCLITNNDIKPEVVKNFQRLIISKCNGDITFKMYKNTNYRESLVLYNEISKKLKDLDGVTFFGHNKGISNSYFGIENVKMWICALYYFSFEYDLPFDFLNGPMSYGPLKVCCCNEFFISSGQSVHDWHYAGTFFWLKCQQLDFYLKSNNIELPQLTNRWYSEMFLGNVMPNTEAWSYNDRYLLGDKFDGYNVFEKIKKMYEGNDYVVEDFLNFFKENS